jgi:hypothetical protein
MSKSLDQLARNLASGMSRRKAIWQFITGLGVVAALTGRKAYAEGGNGRCGFFCDEQALIFAEACYEASAFCPKGTCPEFTLIELRTGIRFNSSLFTCTGALG